MAKTKTWEVKALESNVKEYIYHDMGNMKGSIISMRISFVNLVVTEEKMKMQARIWRNEAFVRENMLNTHIISEDEHKNYLAKLQNSISDKAYLAFFDDEPFGVLNMHMDFEGNKLEFGYYLTNQKYVDSGFGAILEYVLLNHSFFQLKVDTVFCRTLTSNKKVVALHKRFGFDVTKCDEQICYQSISTDKWNSKREFIEKIIGSIFSTNDIGALY